MDHVPNLNDRVRMTAPDAGVGPVERSIGRARRLVGARVINKHEWPVGAVVCVHDRKMDEPWCLVASEATVPTRVLIRCYGKRWGIEADFRDIKDMRFGMGLLSMHVLRPDRRDRQLAAERRAGRRQAAPFAKERPQGRGGRPGRRPGRRYGRPARNCGGRRRQGRQAPSSQPAASVRYTQGTGMGWREARSDCTLDSDYRQCRSF